MARRQDLLDRSNLLHRRLEMQRLDPPGPRRRVVVLVLVREHFLEREDRGKGASLVGKAAAEFAGEVREGGGEEGVLGGVGEGEKLADARATGRGVDEVDRDATSVETLFGDLSGDLGEGGEPSLLERKGWGGRCGLPERLNGGKAKEAREEGEGVSSECCGEEGAVEGVD